MHVKIYNIKYKYINISVRPARKIIEKENKSFILHVKTNEPFSSIIKY